MSNGEVKRLGMCTNKTIWNMPPDDVLPPHVKIVETFVRAPDHERIVAKLRSEIEQHNALHEHEAVALGRLSARIDNQAFLLSENTKTIASQRRVINGIRNILKNHALSSNQALIDIREAIEKGEA